MSFGFDLTFGLGILIFFDNILGLSYYFTFVSFLIVISVYDIKHKLIPDFATVGIAVLAIIRIVSTNYSLLTANLWGFGYDILATLATFVFFGLLWYFSNGKAMGFGDVKLAPALVLFLGASKGILATLLSFWIGAIVGIVLILGHRAGWKSEIPFGPFLALGAFTALLWGGQLIDAYSRMF